MKGPFARSESSNSPSPIVETVGPINPRATDQVTQVGGWRLLRGQLSLSSMGLEIGIVSACVTAMLTVGRLFTDQGPVVTIAVAALLAHGIAISARWCRLPWIASAAISAIVLVLTLSGAFFPDTARFLVVPTGASLDVLQRSLIEAWNTFLTVEAPTEPMVGFTVLGFAGAWLISTLTDAIAYRLGFLIEALVPSAVVVTLTSALASDGNRVRVLAPYVASVCVVVGSARVRELARDAWLGGKPRRAGAIGATLFVITAVSAVSVAVSRPPSWVEKGLLDRQQDSKASSRANRTASNPLVSTRAHLVALSNQELFIGKSDVRSYWRLTALDTYVNDQWTAGRGTYREEDAKTASVTDRTVEIKLQGFDDTWLPVQRPTGSVTGAHPNGVLATPSFDRYSGSVLLDDLAGTGDTYQVIINDESTALSEVLDLNQLTALIQLPADLTPAVAELARSTTALATTDNDRMLMLQQFFRSQFVYDLDVAKSSSLGIDQFLFEVRRGYCEQFASSFAVMARALGIPSRVAIGFVPGELTEDGYQVRGQDAHAWPEVYIDGRWVMYEPTPGRGSADGNQPVPTTLPPTTITDQAPTSVQTPVTTIGNTTETPQDSNLSDQTVGVPVGTILWLLAAVFAIIGLWFVPWAVRRLRSGRGLTADSDAISAEVAREWRGLEDDLAWSRNGRPASQPIGLWLARLRRDGHAEWSNIADVANRVETARYGAVHTSISASAALATDIRALRKTTIRALPAQRRLRRWLSLRLRPRAVRHPMPSGGIGDTDSRNPRARARG